MESQEQIAREQIARLWEKITARIAEDGGVMHRSSFEQEVSEWLRPKPKTYSSGSEILAEMRLQEAMARAHAAWKEGRASCKDSSGANPVWYILNKGGATVALVGEWRNEARTSAFISGLALRVVDASTDLKLDGWIVTKNNHEDGVTVHRKGTVCGND